MKSLGICLPAPEMARHVVRVVTRNVRFGQHADDRSHLHMTTRNPMPTHSNACAISDLPPFLWIPGAGSCAGCGHVLLRCCRHTAARHPSSNLRIRLSLSTSELNAYTTCDAVSSSAITTLRDGESLFSHKTFATQSRAAHIFFPRMTVTIWSEISGCPSTVGT